VLREGVVFQMLGGGKRVRATLCAAVCELFSGSYRPALSFAAGLEHLQNFTLVHDDIADGDVERRGRPTTWTRFGIPHAINIGDAFIPLSAFAILDSRLETPTQLRLFELLSTYGLEVAEGQSMDIALREADAPTEEAYVACSAKKTGGFFAIAVLGGAIIGGAPEDELDDLAAFAHTAGVAFQIKDDLLDVIGGKGRRVGSDIREGKRTMLAAYALELGSEAERRRLIEILNRPRADTTATEIAWVHGLYARTGAQVKAEATAERFLTEAIEHLDGLPRTPARYRFLRLCRHLTRRSR
jgi:geranylgeranyl pyrophosphate synthase